MAKYRPIETRLWNDRKFLSLGVEARLLWMFLLTTPSTLPIPGVIVAGDHALAEQLGWTVERFRERFREVQLRGLSVAREGSVMWLRNATKYQSPSNPNMIKGWSKCWDDVPEGDLKHEIWQALKLACKSWDRTFAKQFPEPLRDGSGNGFANGFANGSTQDQEQDQEQKQDQDQDLERVARAIPPSTEYDPEDPAQRGRLTQAEWRAWSKARMQVAQELGLDALPFPEITPSSYTVGYQNLRDRVGEEGKLAPSVCLRVREAATARARETESIEWLSEKSFTPGGWRHAREQVPGWRGGADARGNRSAIDIAEDTFDLMKAAEAS